MSCCIDFAVMHVHSELCVVAVSAICVDSLLEFNIECLFCQNCWMLQAFQIAILVESTILCRHAFG